MPFRQNDLLLIYFIFIQFEGREGQTDNKKLQGKTNLTTMIMNLELKGSEKIYTFSFTHTFPP
jgi:hypothetical protein